MPASNRVVGVVIGAAVFAGCGERRDAAPSSGAAGALPTIVRQVELVPGPATPAPDRPNPFAGDDHARAEGRRLYHWMNCSGCHFEGGGGIGPPLMDEQWIYGGRPAQIFDSIASGRANGMPAYGTKLPAAELWKIVAHVESLSDPSTGAPPDAGWSETGGAREERNAGQPSRGGQDDR